MYESPIEIIESAVTELQNQQEEGVFRAIKEYGISVNREELIKALNYDRDQYNKGYDDGVRDFAEEMEYNIIHKEYWNEHPYTSQTWLNGYEQCLRDMRVLLKHQIAKEMGVEL